MFDKGWAEMSERKYLCIDQKSFYATVECVMRGLDPMKAKLVVADPERSENTICLAVSPALKALGVKNRCRIKEVPSHLDVIIICVKSRKRFRPEGRENGWGQNGQAMRMS